MPRFSDLSSSVWTAPGIVPGLLGVALAFMAAILFFRALRERREVAEETGVQDDASTWWRVGATLLLCIGYAGVLVGHMPFSLATGLFTFAFIVLFELWGDEAAQRHWVRHVLIGLAIAVIAGWLIAYVFANIFLVSLP